MLIVYCLLQEINTDIITTLNAVEQTWDSNDILWDKLCAVGLSTVQILTVFHMERDISNQMTHIPLSKGTPPSALTISQYGKNDFTVLYPLFFELLVTKDD